MFAPVLSCLFYKILYQTAGSKFLALDRKGSHEYETHYSEPGLQYLQLFEDLTFLKNYVMDSSAFIV